MAYGDVCVCVCVCVYTDRERQTDRLTDRQTDRLRQCMYIFRDIDEWFGRYTDRSLLSRCSHLDAYT